LDLKQLAGSKEKFSPAFSFLIEDLC
jgi:hypothetical protein